MGDVMLFGVLRMPYDMAMADEYTRYQYHQRGLQAANVIEALRAQLADARNNALEDAARRLLRCFPNMGMIDEFAAEIRALKESPNT